MIETVDASSKPISGNSAASVSDHMNIAPEPCKRLHEEWGAKGHG